MPARPTPKTPNPRWFEHLPDAALIREQQIIPSDGNPTPLVHVSASTWWRWVRAGKAPQPIRMSDGVTAYRVGDLRQWLERQGVQS